MKFSQVVGSESSWSSLRDLVSDDIMPHALLISGPQGNNKLPAALAYAAYIMCENKENKEACGECRACKKTFNFIHPDVHFSFPFFGSNAVADEFIKPWRSFLGSHPYGTISEWLDHLGAGNKQANINVKECRSIIHKLNMQSFESDKKILFLWLPEYLKKEGNRLLKIIEEPTDNTYFILVTAKVDHILPTIISRCQHIKLPPLQDDEIKNALQEKGVSHDQAQNISFISEGNMNKALELTKNTSSSLDSEVLSWLRACYGGKAMEIMNWVEAYAKKSKDDQKSFLSYGLHFLREIARVGILPDNQLRIQEKEIETAKKIARIINFEKIEKLSNILTDTIYYIERNANIKILMCDTSLSFKNVLHQK
jgi:DNA polymerase-3 subunit delta'